MKASQPIHESDVEPEEAALERLTDRFGHRVRFFAFRIEKRFGIDPQWRDDLISSGYWGLLKALRNRRLDAHERELSAYVSKRVEGAILDEARRVLTRNAKQVEADVRGSDSQCESDHDFTGWTSAELRPDPERLADRMRRWRNLEDALEILSEDHRRLLWAYAEGRSLSEIARCEGLSSARLQSDMNQIARQVRAHAPELRRLLRYEI